MNVSTEVVSCKLWSNITSRILSSDTIPTKLILASTTGNKFLLDFETPLWSMSPKLISGFNSKHGNSDGGEGGPLFTILYGPAIKSYGSKGMEIVILHELFHTQGAAYDCGKRTYRGAHVKGSDVLGSGDVTTKIDSKNDTYYKHGIEGCPDLADSIFLFPQS